MSRWEMPWVLVVAWAPLACGNAGANQPLGGAGAGGSSGVGGGGSSGVGAASSSGGVGAPAPPVDPAVSATYTWAECGRIEASSRPVTALYTPDESVIEVEENGRVRLFPNGSPVALTIVPARADSHGGSGALLSPDGRWLLAPDPPGAVGVYAADDRAPLGAATKSVAPVTRFITSATPGECGSVRGFSSDSQQVLLAGPESLCVAEIEGGTVLATVAVAPAQGAVAAAWLDGSPEPLRAWRNGKLLRYAADGTLVSELDPLADKVPAGEIDEVTFTPDARQLLITFTPDEPPLDQPPGARGILIELDSETGAELWREPFFVPYDSFAIAPDSSIVQISLGATIRSSDGERLGSDPEGFSRRLSALGPGGRRELRIFETLVEMDTQSGKLRQLYGSHIDAIRDLDISRDGRFLASHGDAAIVWRLDDDFARSTPLFNGAAPDDSWNVALAADGSILAVSGDNVAFFKPDGSWVGVGLPFEGGPVRCLSADWSFSPLGSWAAGTHYGNEVVLFETPGLEATTTLPTQNCWGGVAFSADGSRMVTASLELFDTATWSPLWTTPPVVVEEGPEQAVQFSPDGTEIVVTRCTADTSGTRSCRSERRRASDGALLGALPGLTGERARYSPEGHWVLSDNNLLHVPTGKLVGKSFPDGEALFAPNGDIIAGEADGSLVRYCRSAQ